MEHAPRIERERRGRGPLADREPRRSAPGVARRPGPVSIARDPVIQAMRFGPATLAHRRSLYGLFGDAARVAPVQRLIATTQANLVATLAGPLDPLVGAMNTVDGHITTYNQIAQNMALAQAARVQQQLDQLRILDRAVHAALGQVSAAQFEIRNDARVMVLHTLLQESEVEHRALVDTVVASPVLRAAVDPFDAATTGVAADDLTPAAARLLWASLMDGTGKLQLVGAPIYQGIVRSWLTKLMDTKQGRRLLRYLNTGNTADLGTNVYIGELLNQLPPAVRLVPNASNDLEDAGESVAQPLLGLNTKATLSGAALHNPAPVANADQYNDAVLNGATGVAMGGNDYAFGQSSGSFVNITAPGALGTAAGAERANALGAAETPEIYQPDWMVLGHELGHSANMRAGATTEGGRGLDNPTDVFSRAFTGQNNRDARQNQWYGGSEEYINIVGNEDRLRAQAGLDQRDAHTSAQGRELQRREPQVQAAFAENVWIPQFDPASPTELARYQQYNARKIQILQAFTATPRSAQHLVDATNLGQATTVFFAQRTHTRAMTRGGFNAVLNGDASRNALDPARGYEATLQAQFDLVKASIMNELIETPGGVNGLLKAQRIVLFCQAWRSMRLAHDAAGLGKQFKYKGWWDAAKRSVQNVGTAIDQGDNVVYTRKFNRVVDLRNDYQ